MKRILPFLVAMFATVPALAAGPIKEADLPDVFKKEPPYMQNQICGELMARMARMSADLYTASAFPGVREAAVMAGTRAMMFVKANAALSKEERERAERIADQLEKSATPGKPAVAPYQFCEERAQRWLKEGVVAPADVRLTEKEVRDALDKTVPLKK
ncbi:hypothetical protein WJ97_13790 [Burkholderia ubonensis]|uniref:hypothetical protein n=1 Tax=Burkholderia ubonensis TaxID=101571 RepID=UPI00075390EA|nr:hypothetical protein [Burkholderia ubonensis]KVP96892.1 hypothetical protein WJ97_13790 [Burkholderia ubonensis]